MEKVAEWNATVISKHECGTQPCVVCEAGRSCEERLKDVQGREGGSACRKHDNGKVLEGA